MIREQRAIRKMAPKDCARMESSQTDAYSYFRYGPKEWRRCIDRLNDEGYTPKEINAIMRSKLTRWAADVDDLATAALLLRYLEEDGSYYPGSEKLKSLVEGTPDYVDEGN